MPNITDPEYQKAGFEQFMETHGSCEITPLPSMLKGLNVMMGGMMTGNFVRVIPNTSTSAFNCKDNMNPGYSKFSKPGRRKSRG